MSGCTDEILDANLKQTVLAGRHPEYRQGTPRCGRRTSRRLGTDFTPVLPTPARRAMSISEDGMVAVYLLNMVTPVVLHAPTVPCATIPPDHHTREHPMVTTSCRWLSRGPTRRCWRRGGCMPSCGAGSRRAAWRRRGPACQPPPRARRRQQPWQTRASTEGGGRGEKKGGFVAWNLQASCLYLK